MYSGLCLRHRQAGRAGAGLGDRYRLGALGVQGSRRATSRQVSSGSQRMCICVCVCVCLCVRVCVHMHVHVYTCVFITCVGGQAQEQCQEVLQEGHGSCSEPSAGIPSQQLLSTSLLYPHCPPPATACVDGQSHRQLAV